MKKYLDELKSIEERFLSNDPDENKDQKDVGSGSTDSKEIKKEEPKDEYNVDAELTSKEVDDIHESTPEDIKETLNLLLNVAKTSIEKISAILDQVENPSEIIEKDMLDICDELMLDTEEMVEQFNEFDDGNEIDDSEESDDDENPDDSNDDDSEKESKKEEPKEENPKDKE